MNNKLKTAERLIDNLELDKALPLVHSLIDLGVVEAYGMLAYIYDYKHQTLGMYNKKIIKNAYTKYYEELEKDFNNGNLLSGMKLAGALRFYMSNNIDQNDKKALFIYQKCASNGLDKAAIILSEIYRMGDLGVKVDFDKSISLLEAAVKRENIEAMHELGILLFKINKNKALNLIQMAAQRGYWQSIDYLASIHINN